MSPVVHRVKSESQIAAEIKKLILTLFPHIQSPSTDTDLLVTGVLDSLSWMDLIMSIEAEFHIEFPPSVIQPQNFRSIQSITNLVQHLLESDSQL